MKTAFLFPGQGAHRVEMLDALKALPDTDHLLELANDVAGVDLPARIRAEGPAYLRRNEVVALVTAVFSLGALNALRHAGIQCEAVAGYSVGQWVAMASAGMLDREQLMQIIWRRSICMNEAPDIENGAMLSVIGLATDVVERVCREVSRDSANVTISNYNCIGQLTVAGHRAAIGEARKQFEKLNARQLVALDVSGAWHCAMMTPAATAFQDCVNRFEPKIPGVPVIDNVSGGYLPAAFDALRSVLVRHLDQPVQWERGMKTLMAAGIERFVEVGFGNVLTKFGFFIDRSRKHLTYDALLKA